MALVAYSDDSDLGSDSEGPEENVNCIEIESKIKPEAGIVKEIAPPLVHSNFSPAEDKKEKISSVIYDIVDEEDDEGYAKDRPSILASIPAAIPIDSSLNAVEINEEDDELTDVPTVDTWKVTAEIKKGGGDVKPKSSDNSDSQAKSTFIKKKEKSKVKFFVPSLSEFDDDEEEEEKKVEPERKKLKPSSTGTGLFSVLPQPKNLSVKETKRALIPYILTKAPSVQKPSKPKPAFEKKVVHNNDSDEEEESGPIDFFSLSESPADLGALPTIPIPPVKAPVTDVQVSIIDISRPQAVADNVRYIHEEQMPSAYVSNPQQEEMPNTFQDQMLPDNPSTADEEAMIRLMGKRRGKGETINFINVNADDALLTRDEWMTKALSEEKPSHSFSKKKEGLPSQKQKQKHQITYLAHQAKERELELKNNWSQSRMTKMQTQAKYGF